jgi:hypothetical protein
MPFYQLPSGASPVLAGTSPPTGGIGQNGDLFIDTSNKFLYGPKAAGSWPSGIDLSQGPTGPTSTVVGPTGPSVTGPTGGIAFSVGPTAPTAPSLTVAGAVWLDETTGRYFVRYQTQFIEIGVQGERGPTGNTGPQSTVTGPTGAQSTVTGPTGGVAFAATGPTAPNLTAAGSVWLDTASGKYFVRYDGQFIEIGVQGERGPTGAPANRGANVQTLATGITLTENSARYQFLTATGSSQTITLPTGMGSGLDFVIKEVDSFFGLAVETPAAANVVTVYSTPQLIVWDGSTWRVISYSS